MDSFRSWAPGNVNDWNSYGVFRIDPVTKIDARFHRHCRRSAPAPDRDVGLAIEAGGTILLSVNSRLLTIDPLTGNGSIFSDATHGSGASFAGWQEFRCRYATSR